MRRLLLVVLLAGLFSSCRQMGSSEYGVRFRKLPPGLGGGVARGVVGPGEMVVIWPWDSLYRFDTKVKNVEWGGKSEGGAAEREDYVHTRALDGNEVALAVKVQYNVSTDPAKLMRLVDEVATEEEQVRSIVVAVARSEIRRRMNELPTSSFFDNAAKYKGEQRILEAMRRLLGPYGIDIQSVNLKEHRFERVLPDGSIDRSYQDKINEVQAYDEQTKREILRVNTVKADKAREYSDVTAEVNRQVAEARGYLQQTKLRGDGYYKARENDAKALLAAGKAEVEGLIEQINALAGPGGEALLKLRIVENLLKANPRFVVLNESEKGDGLQVRRLDTNDLLRQAGVFEGLIESPPMTPAKSSGVAAAPRSQPKDQQKEKS